MSWARDVGSECRRGRVAPNIYQLHAIIAWGFWAFFLFSRLVRAWSIPQYIGRPHVLYRRRYSTAR